MSLTVAANTVELWLRCGDVYQPCLSIPLETCSRFATYPLAWLSHLGFCLCAREGHISDSDNGPAIEYRDSPAITPGIYYYIIAEVRPLWLDAEVMNDRTSFGSARTACRQNFRQDIINRDGNCLVTNASSHSCQACHIIPHSRGDQYISNIAVYRDEDVEPPLEAINDTRNGLLLQISLHLPFGESSIAFLKVPNHAMNVTDVAHVTQPHSIPISLNHVRKRLILQHFNTQDEFFNSNFPHNCEARISDSPDWPPDVLFDVTYGSAALKSWGHPHFKGFLQASRRGRGSRGRGGGGQRGRRKDKGKGRAQEGDHIQQSASDARAARAKKWSRRGEGEGQAGESRNDSLDLVLEFWKYNARSRQYRDSDEVMNTDRNQDEVQAWLNSVS